MAGEHPAASVSGHVDPMAAATATAILLGAPDLERSQASRLLERFGDPVTALEALHARSDAPEGSDPLASEARRVWLAGPAPGHVAATVARRTPTAWWRDHHDWPIRIHCPDQPALLLAEGRRADALGGIRVAVVGTRAATPHGLADAREIGAVAARCGASVVSGLAIGIDAAAHHGAIDAGGLVVGVVATGLDVVYPRRHQQLYAQVRRHGVLLSESGYGTQPQRWRFPVRNRIIAALAEVVVVVEATERGGARITADHALDYGIPVLAIPGSRRNPAAAGCNALIADGAHPLLSPDDLCIALGFAAAPSPTRTVPSSADERAVLAACGGEPATPDEICDRTGLGAADVARLVRSLESAGLVCRNRGLVWPL